METFVIAAEEQNFRRAAERLHMAQPTVTAQIQKLEQAWGVDLFLRVGRGVTLSPAGRRFVGHANEILQRYREAQEDMARWLQGYEETISIAVSPIIATTFLPHWMRAFGQDHPKVEFSIQVMESNQILPWLVQNKVDVGLTRLAEVHPEVHCERLYADPVRLVAPVDEPGSSPLTVPELLRQYTLFTHNHPEYWEELLTELRRSFPGIRTMQVSQVHVTLHLIGERLGISFLPKSIVDRELSRGRVQEVPFREWHLPGAASYLMMRMQMRQIVREFTEFVSDYVQKNPPLPPFSTGG